MKIVRIAYGNCMREGHFPTIMKIQGFVLSSYHPLCLLDLTRKELERKGKSTIEAISFVGNVAEESVTEKGVQRKYSAVIALDIKKAFDCARWAIIKGALGKMGVHAYLAQIIDSYLSDRKLHYGTSKGQKTYEVTTGVSKGLGFTSTA